MLIYDEIFPMTKTFRFTWLPVAMRATNWASCSADWLNVSFPVRSSDASKSISSCMTLNVEEFPVIFINGAIGLSITLPRPMTKVQSAHQESL